jgi:hypothetical protein
MLKAVCANQKILKLLPLFAAVLGAAFGVLLFLGMPDILPASNIYSAILVGGASGLAATGTSEAIKKFGKPDEKADEDNTKTDGNTAKDEKEATKTDEVDAKDETKTDGVSVKDDKNGEPGK